MKKLIAAFLFIVVGIIASIIAIVFAKNLDGTWSLKTESWISICTAFLFYVIGGAGVKKYYNILFEKNKESEKSKEGIFDDNMGGISPSKLEKEANFVVVTKQVIESRQYYITIENDSGYNVRGVTVENGNSKFYEIIDETSIPREVLRHGKFTVSLMRRVYGSGDDIIVIVGWFNLSSCRQKEVIKIAAAEFK